MNKYNGLLSSVAHKYHICKGARETENEWKTRLVYSICGMMAYASLWDDPVEGANTISIVRLGRRHHFHCALKEESPQHACKLQINVPGAVWQLTICF